MKARLIQFYNSLDQDINLKWFFTLAGWILGLIITLYTLVLLSLPLYETSAPKGVVFARDNDGGRAIETSIITRWYNSNHFAPYGNLYYRLSHTLADLIELPTTEDLPALEKLEKTHNFTLKLVSLLSVFGFSFFLVWIFVGFNPSTLVASAAATYACLHIPMWTFWVFRPHPDHLLSLTTAVALFYFGKFLLNKEERKYFVGSALLWGLAMAVKRSTATFVPGIILFLIFPISKKSAKKTLSYIGYMLLSYLVIGFPQNFGFYKHIKFLLYESSLHSIGLGTLPLNLTLIWSQIKVLLPVVFVLSFFSVKKEERFSPWFLLFIFLGFIPVLMRELTFVGDHHTMPLAISLVIAFTFFLLRFNPMKIPKYRVISLFILSLLTLKLSGIPEAYSNYRDTQLQCRQEISELNSIITKKVGPDFQIVKDAIFPSNSIIDQYRKTVWGLRWVDVTPNVGFLGIDKGTINVYQGDPPRQYYGKMTMDWDEKVVFYRDIRNQESVVSPNGQTFKKIYSKCSFELWEKE